MMTNAQNIVLKQFVETPAPDAIDDARLNKLAQDLGVTTVAEAKGILSARLARVPVAAKLATAANPVELKTLLDKMFSLGMPKPFDSTAL